MSDELANKGWIPADQLPPREKTELHETKDWGETFTTRHDFSPYSPDLLVLGENDGDLYPFVGWYDYDGEAWYLAAYDSKYGPHGSTPEDGLVIRWWRPFPDFWPVPNEPEREDAPNA